MATVKPFRAVRPAKQYADKVISLPYDVMNRQEAAEMAEGNPYSFLHICRAEIDLPQAEQHSQEVYAKARDNIADFMAKGILTQEEVTNFPAHAPFVRPLKRAFGQQRQASPPCGSLQSSRLTRINTKCFEISQVCINFVIQNNRMPLQAAHRRPCKADKNKSS